MKRIVISANDTKTHSKYSSYAKSLENFMKDARRKIKSGDYKKALFTLDRAEDHLQILHDKAESEGEFWSDFQPSYAKYWNEIRSLRYEINYRINPITWNELSGADQYAVEVAMDLINRGESVDSAVSEGVHRVNEGNAEPEYADEDFYLEEANYDNVIRYLYSANKI